MVPESALITAPGQILERGPTITSPTTYAASDTNAVGCTLGDFPSSALITELAFSS